VNYVDNWKQSTDVAPACNQFCLTPLIISAKPTMTTPTHRITLAEHFSQPVLAPLIQMKGLFSKHAHVKMLSAFYSGLAVYQQAAVLGYARRAQMETLAKLLSPPGKEREACDALIEATKQEVAGYGHPPESFIDFFTNTLAKSFEYQNLETFKRLSREDVRLGVALRWMDTWFLGGVGLGLAFPELVERMWRNSYETNDPEAWEQARQAGLDIPQHDTPLPLDEMEQVVLFQVTQYAREYVPEVIEPLRLP